MSTLNKNREPVALMHGPNSFIDRFDTVCLDLETRCHISHLIGMEMGASGSVTLAPDTGADLGSHVHLTHDVFASSSSLTPSSSYGVQPCGCT